MKTTKKQQYALKIVKEDIKIHILEKQNTLMCIDNLLKMINKNTPLMSLDMIQKTLEMWKANTLKDILGYNELLKM